MEAAIRELKEESGFVAQKKLSSERGFALCYPDPWKSSESYLTCEVEIDGDAPCNQGPRMPMHEPDEHFAGILLVPLSSLATVLPALSERGVVLETRLVSLNGFFM